jgi:hypothetical protein
MWLSRVAQPAVGIEATIYALRERIHRARSALRASVHTTQLRALKMHLDIQQFAPALTSRRFVREFCSHDGDDDGDEGTRTLNARLERPVLQEIPGFCSVLESHVS